MILEMRIQILLALTLCATTTTFNSNHKYTGQNAPAFLAECMDLALRAQPTNLRIEHLEFDIAGDALSVASGS